MRDGDVGVVLRYDFFFWFGVGVFADEGLDIFVGGVGETGGVVAQGREVVEEEERGRWVFEGGGEKRVIGTEKGDAV